MQIKSAHDKNLLILMGVGAGILLLAALGLFLVQGLSEEPPGDGLLSPSQTSTSTATATHTLTATSTGTRRPTRTPVPVTDTPVPGDTSTPANTATANATATQPAPSATSAPASTATQAQPTQAQPTRTITNTPVPPTDTQTPEPGATDAPTPTVSPTMLADPLIVMGKVVNQKVPIENVTITIEVIVSAQETLVMTTTSGVDGAYQFQVNWTNKEYNVVFALEENPQLGPASNYVAWSWIEGQLFGDVEMPDLEISAAPTGPLFEQVSPANGSSISASQISSETPLTFEWTTYPQAEQYWVDLGRQGEDSSVWSSLQVLNTSVDFDGTLTAPPYNKIGEGTYWWAVGTIQTPAGFRIFTYSNDWTLVITP